MTDFDRKLIELAETKKYIRYTDVDAYIKIAESQEALDILRELRWFLYDHVVD